MRREAGTSVMLSPVPAELPGSSRRRARATTAPVAGVAVPAVASPSRAWPDPMRAALIALLVLTIGRLHQHYAFLMPLRPALLTAAVAAGYAVLRPGMTARNGVMRTWPARVVLWLAGLSLMSAIFGLSFGQSASFIIESFSKVVLLWALLVLAMRNVRELSMMVWGYLAGVGFLVYLSLFVYQLTEQFGSLAARLDDEAAYMYDPNDIGVMMVPAIPLFLLQMTASNRVGKIISAVMIVGIAWATARAGSRGSMIGLVAVGAMLLFTARGVAVTKRIAMIGAVVAGLVVAAPPGYWSQMSTLLEPKGDYNWDAEDGRMKIWSRGMGYMVKYPAFGVGIDNFGRAEGTISVKAKYHDAGTGLLFAAPHNSFVQAGAELGIPGLLLWSSLSIGGMIGMLRLRRRLPVSWQHGTPEERYLYNATTYLAVAFIGFIGTAAFVSFAWLDPIYIFAAYAAAIYALTNERLAAYGGRPARRMASRGA